MAGSPNARRLTEDDKAQIVAMLAANGGNVKLTARELGIGPATVRRYRDRYQRGQGPSQGAVVAVAGAFVDRAEAIRDKALATLDVRIDQGVIKTSELITAVGVLDDKIRLAKGLQTQQVNHTIQLPSPDEMRAALGPVVQAAIEAAGRRHDEIVEAEVVEVEALPAAPAVTLIQA